MSFEIFNATPQNANRFLFVPSYQKELRPLLTAYFSVSIKAIDCYPKINDTIQSSHRLQSIKLANHRYHPQVTIPTPESWHQNLRPKFSPISILNIPANQLIALELRPTTPGYYATRQQIGYHCC